MTYVTADYDTVEHAGQILFGSENKPFLHKISVGQRKLMTVLVSDSGVYNYFVPGFIVKEYEKRKRWMKKEKKHMFKFESVPTEKQSEIEEILAAHVAEISETTTPGTNLKLGKLHFG